MASVKGLNNVQMISAGDSQICALLSDKSVWCWGGNGSGQVGNNIEETPEREPNQVWDLNNAATVSAGTRIASARFLKMMEANLQESSPPRSPWGEENEGRANS